MDVVPVFPSVGSMTQTGITYMDTDEEKNQAKSPMLG